MILRILLDQNIPPAVCEFVRVRKQSCEVRHVNEMGLRGATDDKIFQWAQAGGWLVITYDEDFADARMYPAGRGRRSPSSLADDGRKHRSSGSALVRFNNG